MHTRADAGTLTYAHVSTVYRCTNECADSVPVGKPDPSVLQWWYCRSYGLLHWSEQAQLLCGEHSDHERRLSTHCGGGLCDVH